MSNQNRTWVLELQRSKYHSGFFSNTKQKQIVTIQALSRILISVLGDDDDDDACYFQNLLFQVNFKML